MTKQLFAFIVASFLVVTGLEESALGSEDPERDRQEIEASVRLNGNAAGLSTSQLWMMADEIARANGQSPGVVRSEELALLKFPVIGGDVFRGLLQINGGFSIGTGMSLGQSIATLGRIFTDPTQGAEELHRSINLLTYDQTRSIESMQRSGHLYEAQKVLLAALASRVGPTSQPASALVGPRAPSTANQDATPVVPVLVGARDYYTRLVFNWPTPTEYQLSSDAGVVQITFLHTGLVNVDDARPQLPPAIGAIEAVDWAGGVTVMLTVPGTAKVLHFRNQGAVVVDVVAPTTEVAATEIPVGVPRHPSGRAAK